MPLYEYQCDACGHRFEVIQRFSDDPVTACPQCPGSVRRLLSSPAIRFKGSGFYITDYVRKGGEGSKADTATAKGEGDAAASAAKDGKDAGAAGTPPAGSSSSSGKAAGGD